jgi:hypothetical protein
MAEPTKEQIEKMEAIAAKMVAALKELETAATASEKEAEVIEKALEK